MLLGHMRLDEAEGSPLSEGGAKLLNSYEAEQHLLHLGRAIEPSCWTLAGIASGYLSRTENERMFVVEDRCVAMGDAYCRFRARSRAGWGALLDAHLPYFQVDGLSQIVDSLARELRASEKLLRSRRRALGPGASRAEDLGIVARSRAMRELLDRANKIAPTDVSVLIVGESGAGKERVARYLHEESPRAGGPFVTVNCAAVPEALLESEFFGHVRGAFTGAVTSRIGLFESASGGTLFLDEVGELPAAVQAKLLRVLQERKLRRLGETGERRFDARVFTATNRDLAADVKQGRFREDLYYRIATVDLQVPALRERRDDILPLARAALEEFVERGALRCVSLDNEAADLLMRYHWPGNVRELRNAMERVAVLTTGNVVQARDLPEAIRTAQVSPAGNNGLVMTLEAVERAHILAVLARNGGNQVRTAADLRIGEATLYRKLKAYGGIVTPRQKTKRRTRT
jgi:DNA-binding NtrC family response regulator